MPEDTADEPRPEFGPGGYLPERAAKRARKIVLRAPLGIQWIVAAVVAALLVLVAGVLYLRTGSGPPGAPFTRIGAVEQLGTSHLDPDLGVLYVAATGRVRAFADATQLGLRYCTASRHIEGDGGAVWSLTGRGFDGRDSLTEHPTIVDAGVLYVDPTTTEPGPTPTNEHATPACTPAG